MAVSRVDSTYIECSDNFFVWMKHGKVTRRGKKVKCVFRRWRLERFDDSEVRTTYQNAYRWRFVGADGGECSDRSPVTVSLGPSSHVSYAFPPHFVYIILAYMP